MAILGLRDQVSNSVAQRRCAVAARKRAPGSLSVSRKYCLRSIPALQLLPAPVSTMTLVGSSVSSPEDLLHLDVKRRVHGVALLWSIEGNPRDSFIVGFDQDAGVFFLFSHRGSPS